MSSSIVKDPSTSYKLLPCCRARQANRPMWCMRGGSFTRGCQSSLHCPGEMLLEIIPMQGRVSFVLGTSPESPSFVRRDRGLVHPELCVPCTRRQSTAAGVAVGSHRVWVASLRRALVASLCHARVTSLCCARACCSFLQLPGEGGRVADLSPASLPHRSCLPCHGTCQPGWVPCLLACPPKLPTPPPLLLGRQVFVLCFEPLCSLPASREIPVPWQLLSVCLKPEFGCAAARLPPFRKPSLQL